MDKLKVPNENVQTIFFKTKKKYGFTLIYDGTTILRHRANWFCNIFLI